MSNGGLPMGAYGVAAARGEQLDVARNVPADRDDTARYLSAYGELLAELR